MRTVKRYGIENVRTVKIKTYDMFGNAICKMEKGEYVVVVAELQRSTSLRNRLYMWARQHMCKVNISVVDPGKGGRLLMKYVGNTN
jgi:hypothetical protein